MIKIIHYTIYILIFSFTFSASGIKIKAPKSKEKLKIGSEYEIKWKSNKDIKESDKVKIFISFDSGNRWELIAITENDGLYNWEVPNKNSKNCLIKIQTINNSESSISKKEFRIDGPEISISYPSEGDFFSGGDKIKIIWESKNLGNELINITYSKDNGYSWSNVATNIADVGLYIWDIPHLDKMYDECLIKIASNSSKASKISSLFTIVDKSNKIRIIYPNGSELLESGKHATLKWEANGLKANLFKILFSDNSGNTWKRIDSRVLNVNEYLWLVPNIESENCLIKIIAVENEDIYDISEQNFKVSSNPTIKISSPLSNNSYYSSQEISIMWNSVNVRGRKVNIYYSVNAGKKWNIIERGVLNNGNFDWDISEFDTTSNLSKIKIELSNNIRINDITKGNFTIYGKPEINILNQESNIIIEDKSTYKIKWTSKNIRDNRINVYYSINEGKKWNPIAIDILNKGFYDWIIPSLKTVKCIFKIESAVQSEFFSISKKPINITEKPLIVINNSFDNLNLNFSDSIYIDWDTYNLSSEYLNILYSEDSGLNWKPLYDNIIDIGSANIPVPLVSKTSEKCKIKIEDSNNKRVYCTSSELFEIKRPKGSIELLNVEKNIYNYNDKIKIVWNSQYMSDKTAKAYYSINNGQDWKYIKSIKVSDGYFNWEVPDLEFISKNCLIKLIVDNANYDLVNNLNAFQINPAPFININKNLRDTVKTNMPFEINISHKNIDNPSYDLYYSLTKGITWSKIEGDIKSFDYFWNVPSIKGYKNILLKVELSNDNSIADTKKMPVLEQSINIKILQPNGKEKYSVNDKIPIVWSIKKIYDKTIDLYYSVDSGINWNIIELGVKNSGKYVWSISDKNLNSKKCKIKVQSNINKEIYDVSNGLFLIEKSQSFNIITPNDGDILYRGTSTFIYWENIDKEISNVDLFYSLDKGKKWILINKNLSNVGQYNWAVPKNISKSRKCLIKIVSSKDNKLIDYSDKTFIIK